MAQERFSIVGWADEAIGEMAATAAGMVCTVGNRIGDTNFLVAVSGEEKLETVSDIRPLKLRDFPETIHNMGGTGPLHRIWNSFRPCL